jgi:hypothetical protein
VAPSSASPARGTWTPNWWSSRPTALIGSPDSVVEHLNGIAADFGATYFVSSLPAALALAPVIARLK